MGDTMSKKQWFFIALQKPAVVHISVTGSFSPICGECFDSLLCIAVPQTLTAQVVDTLIAGLENAVEGAKSSKSGEGGTMVALYGLR